MDTFVTIDKLAEHLAVSVSTIRVWVRNGNIPENTYLKVGNTYRFNTPLVTAALLAAKSTPKPEPKVSDAQEKQKQKPVEPDVFDVDDDY